MKWGAAWGIVLSVVCLADTAHISWPYFSKTTADSERIMVKIHQKNTSVIFDSSTNYRYGDVVRITGSFSACQPPSNPGQFDYCQWQKNQGISGSFFVKDHELIQSTHVWSGLIWASELPSLIYRRFQSIFNVHPGLIYTMIFGARQDFIPTDIKAMFSNVGLIHLLVVSGAQIGVITGVVVLLFYRLFRFSFLMSFGCLLILQGVYVLIAGLDPSILRSLVMTNMFLWHRFYWLKRYPFWMYLVVAAAAVMVMNPRGVFMPGFWYSFLITFGLLKWANSVSQSVSGPRLLVGLVVANGIAVFVSIPIGLIQNSIIVPMSIIANLWVSWMSSVVLLGGLMCLFVSFLWLDAAAWAGQWIEFIVTVMIHVSRGLSQQGYVFAFDKVSIICIMASSMGLVLMCVSPLVRYRRGLILGIFVINLAGYAYLKQRQLVIALDVGQGDATLIINGFTSILVDTAGIKKNRSIALDRVIPSLRYYGIDRLTAVVLTHHDMDHSGGLDALVLFGIGRSYSNENIGLKNHTHVQKPHRLTYSNLSIDLYPAAAISDDVSANNQGLMVAVVLGNRRFLITGDMDEHTELLLLRHKLIFPVDFLKMGHHGSRYSTSTELLKVTNPRYVWNSAGKFNRYGHPHPFTLKRIENQGVPWGSTHRDGAIVFTIKKHHVRIHHLLSDRSIIIKNKGKSL